MAPSPASAGTIEEEEIEEEEADLAHYVEELEEDAAFEELEEETHEANEYNEPAPEIAASGGSSIPGFLPVAIAVFYKTTAAPSGAQVKQR